ncbi:MAG TPA: glutamate-cysteine ligase family protein [Candidatus Saccharimonadales bacterium]|nr:glutamate-cysteine ligase family protein [Candidatus Saccharimonadales bacterium]
MHDIVEYFTRNFLPQPHESIRRKIGIEIELPVVESNGTTVKYSTIQRFFDWLENNGWRTTVDAGTGEKVAAERSVSAGKGRFGYDKDIIGTDVGYCTLETSLSPENDLFKLVEHWQKIKGTLLEFFGPAGCHLLGYGIQPISPPSRKLIAKKGRYLLMVQDSLNRGQDLNLFAISASSQCHIDIFRDEAIRAVNVMNGIAPLLSAVTSNSSIWKGVSDPEWSDVREIFWDKGWSNRIEQTGIPDEFSDFTDYVNRLCQFRPLMIQRGNEYIKIVGHKTFGDFMRAKTLSVGQTVSGKSVQLESRTDDIQFHSGFAWWQARLAPKFGTIEVRACAQQPENAMFCIAAFALGLIENLPKSYELYKRYSHAEWRKLRVDVLRHSLRATMQDDPITPLIEQALQIAREGLQKRELGEEKFLDILDQRVQKKQTVADEVRACFDRNNLQPFFDLVDIRHNT